MPLADARASRLSAGQLPVKPYFVDPVFLVHQPTVKGISRFADYLLDLHGSRVEEIHSVRSPQNRSA